MFQCLSSATLARTGEIESPTTAVTGRLLANRIRARNLVIPSRFELLTFCFGGKRANPLRHGIESCCHYAYRIEGTYRIAPPGNRHIRRTRISTYWRPGTGADLVFVSA